MCCSSPVIIPPGFCRQHHIHGHTETPCSSWCVTKRNIKTKKDLKGGNRCSKGERKTRKDRNENNQNALHTYIKLPKINEPKKSCLEYLRNGCKDDSFLLFCVNLISQPSSKGLTPFPLLTKNIIRFQSLPFSCQFSALLHYPAH